MTATIHETIEALRETLIGYIEATYHIAHPAVVAQRRALLEAPEGIFQVPFLESTPRYKAKDKYSAMTDIPAAAREAYTRLSKPPKGEPLLFDPPYSHQADAIRTILRDKRNLMIMTGTGSGKTESFLLPILGKLAIEAKDKSDQFGQRRAVRAMVLYPMNALVNDQLGRLRLLFGNELVRDMFTEWCGRTATFARYTSRTPYAGIRTKGRDGRRLKSIQEFFVEIESAANRHTNGTPIVPREDERAFRIREKLREKGKWPAKENIGDWYGSGPWQNKQGEFVRAVTLDGEAELLTRHEAQTTAPDLLITNYSMLEYMMLRPIERTIFDQTRDWLADCPEEKFLIVLDEAHLYRGAQGAEVGLLLRRLRERLGITPDRFQVICATASFSDKGKEKAGEFGGQLSGVDAATFDPVVGELNLRPDEAEGSGADAQLLAAVDLRKFFSESPTDQKNAVASFLTAQGVVPSENAGADLHAALNTYGPFSKLVNVTMGAAQSFDEVRQLVFPDIEASVGDRAVNALIAMGSRARLKSDDASLLPCRVHAFFRGLPGLWACMDPNCSELPAEAHGGPIGKLYAQPRDRCECKAPVLPYFTCRYCGTSYARAYTKDPHQPDYLFAEPGVPLMTTEGFAPEFEPIDLMLEPPGETGSGIPTFYDLASGRLNPPGENRPTRTVFRCESTAGLGGAGGAVGEDEDTDDEEDNASDAAGPGQFAPCGCCGRRMKGGRSSVQDHLTKGDQPFQALVAAQIKVQPPSPIPASEFAPLRGRKVLVFSDSRQVAARLAPALQLFSLKDSLRALLPAGYRNLEADPTFGPSLTLNNAWLSVVVAAHKFGVRLRPELEGASEIMPRLKTAKGATPTSAELFDLNSQKCPSNLLKGVLEVIRDNILGLEPLAIASIREAPSLSERVKEFPVIVGLAETEEQKLDLARAWLRAWVRQAGAWFADMPDQWFAVRGEIRPHKGDFRSLKHLWGTRAQSTSFKKDWIPRLLNTFTDQTQVGQRLHARYLTLEIGGNWRRCTNCTSVHRQMSAVPRCIECGSKDLDAFDPDTDEVFKARKGFYRNPVKAALTTEDPSLVSLIAAEHTAQLNAAQSDEAFSRAEHHEMEFQDINLAWRDTNQYGSTSIDVLSSTTTMEVGIDIGALSGVALRNMPPGRANYQQRAGRAGRRGNAVATVVAFGSADSHDDHYFREPREMIRGQVVDPRLTLENPNIASRHIRAFLLQRYHEARISDFDPLSGMHANLFSVLGTVRDFRDGTGQINRADLAAWLAENRVDLAKAIARWLPLELSDDDRNDLLADFDTDLLRAIDGAVFGTQAPSSEEAAAVTQGEDEEIELQPSLESTGSPHAAPEPEEAQVADPQPDNDAVVDAATDNLLDRLLYWGVLPRYAFPTDVAPFYVFSPIFDGFRVRMEYAPSQGLNVALSQYAPNKQIWINKKQYTSKAIFSPFEEERRTAWGRRRMYYECSRCHHAKTEQEYDNAKRGEILTCEACHSPDSFGPAKPWFRPPGFAHIWNAPAPSVPDEPNETAYATRAKLVMSSAGPDQGVEVTTRIRALDTRQHLLVSNSGPNSDGYVYCTRCGRIESVSSPEANLIGPHQLPFPSDGDGMCPGGRASRGVVLGADFPTDIALFSLRLSTVFQLRPANSETHAALRTVCEALATAACRLLQVESGEILAEYRPALNANGADGTQVEVFLYDTQAGGAGFSPQMIPRAKELFELALEIMEDCPEHCDTSCYRCLRSFRNKLDHAVLDRYVGAQLLRHVMQDITAPFPKERAGRSLTILADELERQIGENYEIERKFDAPTQMKAPVVLRRKVDGKECLVDVHSPIAPSLPVFGSDPEATVVVDDLRIRRHLGEEVEKVLAAL